MNSTKPVEEALRAAITAILADSDSRTLRQDRRVDQLVETFDRYCRQTNPLKSAPAAVLSGVVSDCIDAVEAKRFVDDLKASESRFKVIVEGATDGILILDDFAKIQLWNAAMERITGLAPKDVIGSFIWDVQYRLAPSNKRVEGAREKLRDFNLKYIQDLKSGQTLRVHENRICRPDGSVRTVQFSVSFLQSGAETLFLTTFKDVTDAKALEESLAQSKKLEAIGLLVGGIAHDFNNFLGAIFGRLELAKNRPRLSGEVIRDLEKIETSAKKAAEMTKKLLSYARKETPLADVVDVNAVTKELLPSLYELVGTEIVLTFEEEADLPPVQIGRNQIEQVLLNLCSNARDAIDGAGRVRISSAWSREPDSIVLTVSDTGMGMDDETVSKIFEPFFTTKKMGAGTGLGLSMVQGIVYQNRGEIKVRSQLGQGTSFDVVFPAYRGPFVAKPSGQPVQLGRIGRAKILVVDDEPEILRFAVEILKAHGDLVWSESSAEAAEDLIRRMEAPLDLLITDVLLPRQNGCELAAAVRSQFPEIKVLFISGFSADALEKQGLAISDLQLLPKPFFHEDFLAKVEKILSG